jgi:arabinogalactan oligomer/maltooligosaccharide transport system substrate-binding protein
MYNNGMKKIMILIISSLLLVACSNGCELNGNNVCFNEETDTYLLEPGTKLTMAVEEADYGEAIVELWNVTYPEFKDSVDYVIYDNMDVNEFYDNPVDLPILWDAYAVSIEEQFRPLSSYLVDEVDGKIAKNFKLHTKDYKYLPMSAIGSVFITNLTYLENNGIDVNDSNKDGLVDALDTFEEVRDLGMETKMHLYIDDYYTSFVISTNGFKLFDDHNPYVSGFDTLEFLEAMDTTYQLADIIGEVDNFIYPTDLASADVPFIIGLPTMMINGEEATNKVNYSFSRFPSFKSEEFYPLANSKGYLINNECLYPSSANALLDLIYSSKGKQLYLDNTDEYMVCLDIENYDYHSNNRKGISKSYLNGYSGEYSSFVGNDDLMVSDMLENVKYFDIYKQVFHHIISPEKAVKILVERSNDWYIKNNLNDENVSD